MWYYTDRKLHGITPTSATAFPHGCWKSMSMSIQGPWQCLKEFSWPSDKLLWPTITFDVSQLAFFLGSPDLPKCQKRQCGAFVLVENHKVPSKKSYAVFARAVVLSRGYAGIYGKSFLVASRIRVELIWRTGRCVFGHTVQRCLVAAEYRSRHIQTDAPDWLLIISAAAVCWHTGTSTGTTSTGLMCHLLMSP